MKFKGEPNSVVNIRLRKNNKFVIKSLFKFDKKGNAEYDTSKLSVTHKNKLIRIFGIKEEVKLIKDMSYKELQIAYTEKTGKKAFGIKKVELIKKLEG